MRTNCRHMVRLVRNMVEISILYHNKIFSMFTRWCVLPILPASLFVLCSNGEVTLVMLGVFRAKGLLECHASVAS